MEPFCIIVLCMICLIKELFLLTAIVYKKTIDRQTNHGVFKGSNEKSRDDLQKNFHLTVNKIQVLMNMERPQAQAINGLLCGENGLVESTSINF